MKAPHIPSGRFVLRIPPPLHQQLSQQARARGLSLNALCTQLLESSLPTPPPEVARVRSLFDSQGLLGVVLFGSQARGTAHENSDTDLFLIFEPGTRIDRALYRQWQDDAVSIHASALLSADEAPTSLWLEVAWEGRLLWARDARMTQCLARLRALIATGHYTRKSAHGQGYWIQKGAKHAE